MSDKDRCRPKKAIHPEDFRDFRWTKDEQGDHLVNHCWYSIEGRYGSYAYKPAIATRENNSWYLLHEQLRNRNDELWPSNRDEKLNQNRFITELLYDTSLMHFTSATESWRKLSKLKTEKQDELAELEYAHFYAQTLVSSSIVTLYSSIDVLSHLVFCIDGDSKSEVESRLGQSVLHSGKGLCRASKSQTLTSWYYDFRQMRCYMKKRAQAQDERCQLLLQSIPESLGESGEKLRHTLVHRMFSYVVPVKAFGQWLMLDPDLDFEALVKARELSAMDRGGSWDLVFREHANWFYSENGNAVPAPELVRRLLIDGLDFVKAVCAFIYEPG